MTTNERKVAKILMKSNMVIGINYAAEIARKITEELSLPHVIDCNTALVRDPTHGEYQIQLCGGCKNGPITNEVFCPICGCKIGRRCL